MSVLMLCGIVGLAGIFQSSASIVPLPTIKVTDYHEQALFTAITSGKPGDLREATEAVELHTRLSDPSLVKEQGSSLLVHAVAHAADKSVITFLLGKKVPIDYIGNENSSLLDILMTKTPFALLQKRKKLSRSYAAQCPSQYLYDVAFLLLSHNVPCTKDTLKAAKNTCLEDLLQVNWREEDRFGLTPLHIAVAQEDIPKIELLLTRGAGASFRVQDNAGYTPLYCAVVQRNRAIVKLLFAHGADVSVNTQDNDGHTPLYCASLAGGNKMAMLELLLAHGAQASIDMPDWWGTTPRFLAEIGGCSELKNLFSRYQN